MPDAHELAKVYYAAARAEVVTRLAMREQVLLAAVTSFAVIGGLVVSYHLKNLLGLFPLLSFAFTIVLLRHQWLMDELGRYITIELDPSLGMGKREGPPMPFHWDAWLCRERGRFDQSSRGKLRMILVGELFGTWFLVWVPGFTGLFLCFANLYQVHRSIVWVDGVFLLFAMVPFAKQAIDLAFKWKANAKTAFKTR